jgi:mannose-6-phosphate isomerase-like protein (cupin superfamily)
MRYVIFTFLFLGLLTPLVAQVADNTAVLAPDKSFENILVKPLQADSLQSVFVIWVKKEVPAHVHKEHTETIVVLEGKALMTLNDSLIHIKKGMVLTIPTGTVHSVISVKSRKPLKVLSIQSPFFDGKDRFFVE